MTKSLEIQQKIAELNRELYEPDKTADRMAAINTEIDSLTADLARARASEERQAAGDFEGHNSNFQLSPEHRELVAGVDTRRIMAAVIQGHATGGREAEMQQEFRVEGNVIPWAVLEHRAVATGLTSGGVDSAPAGFINRAFAGSIMEYAGVMRGPGTLLAREVFPTWALALAHPHGRPDSTAVAESTGAFTANELTARSMFRGSLRINRGDLIAFPGADTAMTEELRLATLDGMANDIISRTERRAHGLSGRTRRGPPKRPPRSTSQRSLRRDRRHSRQQPGRCSDAAA